MFKRIIIFLNYLGGGVAFLISMMTNLTRNYKIPQSINNIETFLRKYAFVFSILILNHNFALYIL
jgi:hypothetical protein